MPPFLRARWLDVAALTWRVDPALVRAHVPAGVEADVDGGGALLSLVAFSFADARVLGVRIPLHQRFPEINLRVYVRRGEEAGVVFVRELVPRRLVAGVARGVFNEPYRHEPLRCRTAVERGPDGDERHVAHAVGADGAGRIELWAAPDAHVPAPGTLERQLTHHTIGFGTGHGGATLAYRVHHPIWPLHAVRRHLLDVDLERLYGAPFARLADAEPIARTLAAGSEVTVGLPSSLARFDAERAARAAEVDVPGRAGAATVLFDADCGICTDVARLLARLDRDAQLALVPIASPQGDALLADLPAERRLASMHLVTPDGARRSGGDALAPLLLLVPGLAPLAPLLAACPPVTRRGYDLVARNRHRIGQALGRTACALPR